MILLLFLFWIILNGRVTVEVVVIGAALSAGLTFAAHNILKMDPRREVLFLRRFPGIFLYLLYLVWQIILANLQVMGIILNPSKERPKIVWFPPRTKGEAARVALANSITLTPGTVTVALTDDTICVHALRPELAVGIEDCGFVTKLCRLEGEDNG